MIIYLEGGCVQCCGSPAEVLEKYEAKKVSVSDQEEQDDRGTDEKDISADNKEQTSGVSTR